MLAEFASEGPLLEAARRLRADGFARLDLYSPFPLPEATEILELPASRVGWVALVAGLSGAAGAFLTQGYLNGVDWPLNVGGRPLNSTPAWIPITFELGVLAASLAIVFSLLALFGFPRVEHPLLGLEAFRSATVDGFWLSFTSDGDAAEAERARVALQALGPRQLTILEEPLP